MLPFLFDGELPFENGDYIFVPNVAKAVADKASEFEAYVVRKGEMTPFTLKMAALTDDERQIILNGCLINYNRNKNK
jgi:aconitate hydratase